jgi:hypothetical protein
MSQVTTDPTIFDIVRNVGVVGLFAAVSACFFAVSGFLSMLLSKKPWHIYICVVGIGSTLALGFLSRWSVVMKANNEIVSSGGQANSADVAKALAVAEYGPMIALFGCMLLSAIMCVGAWRSPWIARGKAGIRGLSLFLFMALGWGTSDLIDLNHHIAAAGGIDRMPVSYRSSLDENEAAGEERLARFLESELAMVVKGPGQLAEYSGYMQPQFERALLLRRLGTWALICVALYAIYLLWKKGGVGRQGIQVQIDQLDADWASRRESLFSDESFDGLWTSVVAPILLLLCFLLLAMFFLLDPDGFVSWFKNSSSGLSTVFAIGQLAMPVMTTWRNQKAGAYSIDESAYSSRRAELQTKLDALD